MLLLVFNRYAFINFPGKTRKFFRGTEDSYGFLGAKVEQQVLGGVERAGQREKAAGDDCKNGF